MFLRFTIIAVLSMGLGLMVFSSFEGDASGSTPPRPVPSSAAAPKTHEASPHGIAAESALAVPPIANGSKMPIHAVRSTDLLGDTQLRYDNGTTATIRRDPLVGRPRSCLRESGGPPRGSQGFEILEHGRGDISRLGCCGSRGRGHEGEEHGANALTEERSSRHCNVCTRPSPFRTEQNEP